MKIIHIDIRQLNPESMYLEGPVTFVHACALVNQYCQLSWASQSMDGMSTRWWEVRSKILELNNALQQKDKERVEYNDIKHLHSLPYNFPLTFNVHNVKYNFMSVITYINLHWNEQSDEFWNEKNDINMRDYNPLESPRASSRPGVRETPTRPMRMKVLLDELEYMVRIRHRDILE